MRLFCDHPHSYPYLLFVWQGRISGCWILLFMVTSISRTVFFKAVKIMLEMRYLGRTCSLQGSCSFAQTVQSIHTIQLRMKDKVACWRVRIGRRAVAWWAGASFQSSSLTPTAQNSVPFQILLILHWERTRKAQSLEMMAEFLIWDF